MITKNYLFSVHTINLSKNFGKVIAVNKVNLKINKGEIYSLIGPNGSGKTTLIKLIVGLLKPNTGSISIFNHDIQKDGEIAKSMFGYVSDNPSVYEYLTGKEFLNLNGNLRKIPNSVLIKRINHFSQIFPIEDILRQPMKEYSRGNKQKVAILAALLSEPKLLIIDEPIVGLDPTSIEILGQILTKHARKGGSVIIATHILSFAQNYAHKVGFMLNGRIIDEKEISDKVSLENLYLENSKK